MVPEGTPLTVACTGHRPWGLGLNYDLRTWVPAIQRMRNAYWIPLSVQHERLTVISGMALGWDMIVADAALDAREAGFNVRLICAVPFVGQESRWTGRDSVTWYHTILDQADEVVVVSSGGYSAAKMQTRNEWMVNRAVADDGMLLAAWNGSPGGTANCVGYAMQQQLQMTNVWLEFFGPGGAVRPAHPPRPPAAAARMRAPGKRSA